MCVKTPRREGDGLEYLLMTEALFNRFAPDLQEQDMRSLKELQSTFPFHSRDFDHHKSLPNYRTANDTKSYSMHFWAYSAVNLPVKFILHVFRLNEFKVMQITNALLLFLALLHIVFISRLSESQKLLFILLVVFCPAFWFLSWTHIEIFSYSFVVISLVYMDARKFPAAILCSAIAATQNQPLVLWVAFLWIRGLVYSQEKKKDFFLLSLSMIPAIIPAVFYYTKFGIFSLQTPDLSLKNVSIFKIFDLFFDLSFGMLPYIPIALFLFFGIVIRNIFIRKKVSLSVQIFLLIIAMMFVCSFKGHWHHGTVGPSRYVIWLLPFIFFVLLTEENLKSLQKPKGSIYRAVLWIAIIIQVFIVFYGGGFYKRKCISYLRHAPLAKFVLNHFPALYNPNHKLFILRTSHTEASLSKIPVIYYHAGKCKKALVRGKNEKELKRKCGYIPGNYTNFFKNEENKEVVKYINY